MMMVAFLHGKLLSFDKYPSSLDCNSKDYQSSLERYGDIDWKIFQEGGKYYASLVWVIIVREEHFHIIIVQEIIFITIRFCFSNSVITLCMYLNLDVTFHLKSFLLMLYDNYWR